MITALYAGILGIMYVILSVQVIKGRFHYRISLFDGNND
ncbi:MAG TPA: glutathione S-transferase, partial [Rhodospirillaceae bacterium]|nr:glutathione S-transferase [Rhodospirillaceae bacterium]